MLIIIMTSQIKLRKLLKKTSLRKLSAEVGLTYSTIRRMDLGIGDIGHSKWLKLEKYFILKRYL